jgi:hypothetical protein
MKARLLLRIVLALLILGLASLPLPMPRLAASPPGASEPRDLTSVAAVSRWDSRWVPLVPGDCRTLYHNLGGDPDDYAVELWFRDTDGSLGINRRGYGGLDQQPAGEGAYWRQLNSSRIMVCRGANDPAADQVRVHVWIPEATGAYRGPWRAIDPGNTLFFLHGLGIPANQLTVGLWFKGGGEGVHHLGYGGLFVDQMLQDLTGAFWHNLTSTTVQVTRFPDDVDVEQVRVVVARADNPDFDSDWQSISIGANVITHDLNWPPDAMLVRGECRSGQWGIHQRYAGGIDMAGDRQGAHLKQVMGDSLTVLRWPDDTVCPEFRVRIWLLGRQTYLPLALHNY